MSSLPFAKAIVQRLVDAGHTAYFAGGWVRDLLMKHPSDDIDIATTASPQEIQALFPKTIPVGIAFGIVIVVEGGHHFEVATFRKESEYADGRRPTRIEKATPKEDALRRDFTINGMFWDPLKEELLDYVGGVRDIERRIIRAIGNPHERFYEDRLRMMRAVRYSTRFDFPIEAATEKAILAHAESLLPSVAMERIWQEFKKMSQFAHFNAGLVLLHRLNLLPTIFPDLKGVAIEVIAQRASPLEAFPKPSPTIAELLELFPEDGLEQILERCDALKISREEKNLAVFLHKAKQMLSMPEDWLAKLEDIEWAQFYAHAHADLALGIHAARLEEPARASFLERHARKKKALAAAIHRIQAHTPILRAEHLIAEGVTPGKHMGQLLREAERIAVNNGLEDKEEVLRLLKASPVWLSRQL